nr:MAG TPA: Major capsid protein [Microviridae sp.]
MANIWNATLEPNNDVKQNTFDWTHVNNLTTQIGRITPIQCELVPSKTSFRAKPIPALQLMPMVFPIQTRMRASIAYFRYPLRALWKDYKDFIGNFREGLEEPYHDFNSQSMLEKMLGTGKLMDYLGVPTTLIGKYGNPQSGSLPVFHNAQPSSVFSGLNVPPSVAYNEILNNVSDVNSLYGTAPVGSNSWTYSFYEFAEFTESIDVVTAKFTLTYKGDASLDSLASSPIFTFVASSGVAGVFYASQRNNVSYLVSGKQIEYTLTLRKEDLLSTYDLANITGLGILLPNFLNNGGFFNSANSPLFELTPITINNVSGAGTVSDLTLTTSPYYNSNSASKDKQIKLSAYAARAYEGIYNSVYRDNRNNPYYIDGVVQYNQWIPTYEGGADSTIYELRYANWEKDFLTTSVQSPQQGNAPLVGITTYDQVSKVYDEQGNPTLTQQTKVAMVDEDGKRYSLEFESDKDELKGVKYVELDNGTTVRSARSIFDLVTSGISITDLRNVNAYQKFLELNMRKGYSYKEIIEGRFDVKVRYADLLLPEFFGGFSRDINMNAISQTVDQTATGEGSYKDVLGSQAGIGYFHGGSDANIECFCDEESIIMGLLVITPLPVYTQLLPKHFLYRGLLDHFYPEFNNISFQPITYKEVCPIQAYNDSPDSLTETFGYQRPWYEYCQRYDQAHGLFRTDLSNFLMHRVFDKKPELAQSFLTVDPDQVTDVFSVTDVTDKVYGQILIDCTVKLPVARVAIPRLD